VVVLLPCPALEIGSKTLIYIAHKVKINHFCLLTKVKIYFKYFLLQKRINYSDKQQINMKTKKNVINYNFQHQQQYLGAYLSLLSNVFQNLKNLTCQG